MTKLNQDSFIESNLEPTEKRVVTRFAWFFAGVAVFVTLIVFLTLDPNPSLILAVCAALNVGIILLSIYKLFEWNLLLSPLASTVIGPAWIIYYSWGNLGARIVGEGRYNANPGSLEFYPIAALLSTIGLIIFYLVGFGLFRKQACYQRIKYADLTWRPSQAIFASLVASVVLIYLSNKYEFINGYFMGLEGQIDRGLAVTHYFFVNLAVIIGVSVIIRGKRWPARLFGLAAILLPILMSIGLRSRTYMGSIVITIILCWLTLLPRHAGRAILVGVLAIAMLFTLGTVVKSASVQGDTSSIYENLITVIKADTRTVTRDNINSANIDYQYRMAGFEYPAAIISSLLSGNSPMYGKGVYEGLISNLPSTIRPAGEYSERRSILRNYYGKGLYYGDAVGVPLTSGLADWGLFLGPLIYALIAIYCILAWRIVQVRPSIFVAYLIAGASAGDLFWDNSLFAVKAIGFTWLAIMLLYPLVMPKWAIARKDQVHTEQNDLSKHPKNLRLQNNKS